MSASPPGEAVKTNYLYFKRYLPINADTLETETFLYEVPYAHFSGAKL